MAFSYLNNTYWGEITREERYFCSIAYNYFYLNPIDTIEFINETSKLGLSNEMINQEWEIGYEVALYRDLLFASGKNHAGQSKRYRKRTFDFCCFSEEGIIIIEAKAHEGFSTEQLKEFLLDRQDIPLMLKNKVFVKIVPLISSKYRPRVTTLAYFDGDSPIHWIDLASRYGDENFKKADGLYKIKYSRNQSLQPK